MKRYQAVMVAAICLCSLASCRPITAVELGAGSCEIKDHGGNPMTAVAGHVIDCYDAETFKYVKSVPSMRCVPQNCIAIIDDVDCEEHPSE